MALPVVSICPKCGKEGTQSITYKPNKENPQLEYLTFIHPDGERHFIGRIRSEAEFMGEMNKPETKEEYEAVLSEMVKEITQLIEVFAEQKSGSAKKITRSLKEILTKYGY